MICGSGTGRLSYITFIIPLSLFEILVLSVPQFFLLFPSDLHILLPQVPPWRGMTSLLFNFAGNLLLCAEVDVEKLGRWENPCPHDGFGRWYLLGGGEETKEETAFGLLSRQPQAPQLVGIPVLLL